MHIYFKEDELPNRQDRADVIRLAAERANGLLANPEFFREISEHDQFDYTDWSPARISKEMAQSTLEFKVTSFHPGWLQGYGKTLAYTDNRYPNTLFLNDRRLDRDPNEVAASIIHESVHALDDSLRKLAGHLNDDPWFGHGDDTSIGKENSAPYWIDQLAYTMLTNTPDAPFLAFEQPTISDDGNGGIIA